MSAAAAVRTIYAAADLYGRVAAIVYGSSHSHVRQHLVHHGQADCPHRRSTLPPKQPRRRPPSPVMFKSSSGLYGRAPGSDLVWEGGSENVWELTWSREAPLALEVAAALAVICVARTSQSTSWAWRPSASLVGAHTLLLVSGVVWEAGSDLYGRPAVICMGGWQ